MHKELLLEKSPVFCIAPWTHIHVLTTGEVFPCCMSAHRPVNAIGNLQKGDTLESAWNSEKMRTLRLKMLHGKPSSLCERCYKMEEVGQESWRTSENRQMSHHFNVVEKTDEQGRLDELHLPYLDIRFSNVCNLKCRICNPWLSSKWHKDGVALGYIKSGEPVVVRATKDPQTLWDQIVPLVSKAEHFHFAGGEPLIMEEQYQILELLTQKQRFDVKLSYNTNLSEFQYKKYNVLEMWKPFRNIYLQASLDGMGKRGDYMRKGQNWDRIVENRISMLRQCPHIDFCVLATVSIMNVLHLPDFYKDWVEKEYIRPAEMQLNILFEPRLFNIRGLPMSFKMSVEAKYRDFIFNYLSKLGEEGTRAKGYFESVLRYMFAEDWNVLNEFRSYTEQLDTLRNERFTDTFPELADLV